VIDQFHGIPFFTPVYVRVKKLAFIHEVTKEVWKTNQLPKPLNAIPALLGELIEKIIFRLFYRNTKFMTVSKSTKDDLLSFGLESNKVKIIHNGLHSIKLPKVKKEKKITILYLGALARDKGTEDIFTLFNKLKSKHNNWQFWIAGRGAENYINHLESMKHVKYFGFVSEKKKFELLKRAHIFVNPSIREGWGLTNLEASSQGTPVVGFKVQGLKDSVMHNKTGVLVRKNNLKELEKAVEDLIKNRAKYKKLSTNAKKWSKKFTWEKSGRASHRLLKEIVSTS